MQNPYLNFYRNFYMRTGGFIPTKPLNQDISPGDFFQIGNGEMMVLGNIFRKGIVDQIEIGNAIKLNPANWSFSDGITKPGSGDRSSREPKDNVGKQVIVFSSSGSFYFRGNNPESVKIMNWNDFQQQLIIKMTQTLFSFRELYLVTETVSTSDWTLAISASDKGELEIPGDPEGFDLAGIFENTATKTSQSKDIEYYHRETKQKPVFFKAKKLVVGDEKTVTSDFKWSDMNLDDVEKMFLNLERP